MLVIFRQILRGHQQVYEEKSKHVFNLRQFDIFQFLQISIIIQFWNIIFFLMISIPWKQTRKHQTNLSPSKATFAFSKEKRFKDRYDTLCDSFYNIPSLLGKAPASGIGRGNKIQLINQSTITPSPVNYSIKSQFQQLTRRGTKFGLGRQKIKYNGIFMKSETPEPGHYDINGSITKRGFTIYSKLNIQQPSCTKNPGPAHYKSIESLSATGRYVLSQLTNCPGYKIKDVKPYLQINNTPGPGKYESIGENINKLGVYPNSKHQNSRCRAFSRSAKDLKIKKTILGPGSYNLYSEFGSKY